MNEDKLTTLAAQYLEGNKEVMEQLLLETYLTISYQCSMILKNKRAAKETTFEILQAIYTKIDELHNPEYYHKWIQKMITAACSDMLATMRWEDPEEYRDSNSDERFSPKESMLDEDQTAEAVACMVSELTDDLRLAAVLHSCGGMGARSIARYTQDSEEIVRKNLRDAQTEIKERIMTFREEGIKFLGLGSLTTMLQIDMIHKEDAAEAASVVDAVLGKETSQDQDVYSEETAETKEIPLLLLLLIPLLLILIFAIARYAISAELESRILYASEYLATLHPYA